MAELGAGGFDLVAGVGGALLDLLLGGEDTLLRGVANFFEGGFALRVPLLQLLVASVKISALAARSLSS